MWSSPNDRDDLRDGGAQHFADCITAIRAKKPGDKNRDPVPDFRGRMDRALDILTRRRRMCLTNPEKRAAYLPPCVRPGADYNWSLNTGTLQRSALRKSDKNRV